MNTPWTLIRGATSRLVVLCSVVALTFGSVAPANASPSPTVYAFYEMRDADAWITANTPSHTGLYVRRPDIVPLSGQDPQPCAQSPYYVNSLYYPSTILISLHMGNWADTIAMGTGHGCVGHRYWYWAYTTFFVWHHLGEEWNIPIQTNFFDIHRLRDEFWRFEINGVNKYAMFWNTNAMDVAAQFESQDPNIVTPYVIHDQIQKTMNDGAWQILNGVLYWPDSCVQQLTQNSFRSKQGGC